MSNGNYLYQFLRCVAAPTGKSFIPPYPPNVRAYERISKSLAKAVKALGFKGKFAIHPNQIETIKRGFGPTIDDIKKAVRIVEKWNEMSANGHGSFDMDGEMIDVPVVERARGLINEAEQIGLV